VVFIAHKETRLKVKRKNRRNDLYLSGNVRKVLSSLIVVFTISSMQAQEVHQTPKLVVGVTIDQLRGEYIEAFYDAFGENGFKRLMREGLVYRNVHFDFSNLDQSSAIASIYTGTTPDYNGIPGNDWYDYKTQHVISSAQDGNYIGYSTNDNTSPARLLVSTITDELENATHGSADIFSFAPDKEAAILSGGHSATAAFWIEDNSGKWVSSTYYKEMPWWLKKYSENSQLTHRVNENTWTPLLPIERYAIAEEKPEKFAHDLDNGNFFLFKSSPLVNTEINRLVQECLQYGAIGKRNTTDFIAITYSARNFQQMSSIQYPSEMMDTYVRLDKEIEALLKMLDDKVGLNNTVLFLTSTGYANYLDPIDEDDKTIGGTFYTDRCASLLNVYLMALYGKDSWIEHVTENQIYLNRKLIEERKLELKEVQEKAARFLMDFSGIQNVIPSYKLIGGNDSESIERIKKGYYFKYAGDIFFEIQPGWVVATPDSKPQTVRKDAFNVPLFYFGGGIVAEQIYRPVSIGEIAPTVDRIMRIRSPNAASSTPSYELKMTNTTTK